MGTKLLKNELGYLIPKRVSFEADLINKKYVDIVFDFSFDMTFGSVGAHRNHRSGGTHHRKNGEVFCDTFQGKLAEYYVYQKFKTLNIKLEKPDLEKWKLGEWDDYDFKINNKLINIKSMAFFSNLLLLERKDFRIDGTYLPNDKKYDYFIVSRIKPELKRILKMNRMYYSDKINKEALYAVIKSQKFEADIPGFISNDELVKAIEEKQILPKGSTLNKNTVMDAENYYILSSDFCKIEDINLN